MENYFKLSELCIDKDLDIPQDIADKLLTYHIIPMNTVRHHLGAAIWASQDSGWRPKAWELRRGRSGKSQHTFIKKGAVDWTAENLLSLFQLICRFTEYTRIAVYPKGDGWFIHCDHASNKRVLFISDSRSNWKAVTKADIINILS